MPDGTPDELHLPELALMLATDLAVLDHSDGSLLLVANAVNYDDTDERVDEAWQDAVDRLDAMTDELAAPAPSTVAVLDDRPTRQCREQPHARSEYQARSSAARRRSAPARSSRWCSPSASTVDCAADPLDVYRVLRASNPSPYMYLLRLPGPRRHARTTSSAPARRRWSR